MKKLVLAIGMAIMSSGTQAVTTLGLDADCNSNGTFLGLVAFNGGTYVRCDLPTPIAVNDTVVLAKNSATLGLPIVWTLPGIVEVGNGNAQNSDPATVDNTELSIEAGTQIAGAVVSQSALVISRGSTIRAQGTASDPIVFSSLDNNFNGSGEWGGLVLAGFAESNQCPSAAGQDTCVQEGVNANFYYGGGKFLNTASSGTLEYVVVAEGGSTVAPDSEINGITFYAVSSATTVNNIHVHNNQDDGVEFFGGNVGVNRLWLTCNEDDSVDWDEGYRGSLTDINLVQDDGGAGLGADHAFELASNPNNPAALPQASGTVTNVSISYVGSSSLPDVPFKLKEGTNASFTNVVIGSAYNTLNCDNIDATSSATFSLMGYGCTSSVLPASSATATGFTQASFWSAPACD
ncbi:hypothetical protein [Microbulbifer sp. TYP-18]|uniref:hypothetical protein n=1 Tax=Microbulbifer sp. TYP-18 TaxID=3230024 RepID=UPI0034C5FF3F